MRDGFKNTFCLSIIKYPKRYIALSFLIVALFLPGIAKIQQSFSVRIWLPGSDAKVLEYNRFEKMFGNDESVILEYRSKDKIWNEKDLQNIQELTTQFQMIDDVQRVESPTNFTSLWAEKDDIIIQNILPSGALDSNNVQDAFLKIKDDKVFRTKFLSKDEHSLLLFLYIRPSFDKNISYEAIIKDVRAVLEKYQDQNIHHSGLVSINDAYREISITDSNLIIPIMLLGIFVIFYLTFRNFKTLFLSLFVIILTVLSAFGVEGYLGLIYNNITGAIPIIIMAIGFADIIHLLFSFYKNISQGESKENALLKSMQKNFLPTLLTSLTTIVGFIGFSFGDVLPIRDLGILCAFGIFLAWVFSYTLFIPLLFFSKVKLDQSNRMKSVSLINKEKLFSFLQRFHKGIVLFACLGILLFSFLASKNRINSYPLDFFSKSTKIHQAASSLMKNYSFNNGIDFIVDSGGENDIYDPLFLKNVEIFINKIKKLDEVATVISPLEIFYKINQTFNNGEPRFYTLPEDRRKAADQILFYEMGLPPGKSLTDQLSADKRYLRVIVLWGISDTQGQQEKVNEILGHAKLLGLSVQHSGQSPIYMTIDKYIVKIFFSSMGFTVLFVSLIMLVVLRSLPLALLSLLPNIIPIIVGGGILYLAGITINMGTVIVGAVCFGIAVDDTLHFLINFQQYSKQGLDQSSALKNTLDHTGGALVVTTLILVVGFSSFLLGDFKPNAYFGLLSASILLIALAADIFLLPSLIILFGSKKSQ